MHLEKKPPDTKDHVFFGAHAVGGNKTTSTALTRWRDQQLSLEEGLNDMRVLVVEDEIGVQRSLQQQLTDTGFNVDVAGDGEEGLFAGLNYPLDAAIVDLGLPKRAGLDIIREWRAKERSFPVIVLTVRNEWEDRVEGLCAGADDYVGKPFSFEEVVARLRGLMRRVNGWATQDLRCGPYLLNTRMRTLRINGEAIDLTSHEYRVLEHMMLRAGQPLSATELAERLYAEDVERESNVVTQLIYRLRRKLDPQNRIDPIETVHGGGYRFAVPRGSSAWTISPARPKSRS